MESRPSPLTLGAGSCHARLHTSHGNRSGGPGPGPARSIMAITRRVLMVVLAALPAFTLHGVGIGLKLTSLVIGHSDPSVVSGRQLQLTAQGIYNDGTRKDITN